MGGLGCFFYFVCCAFKGNVSREWHCFEFFKTVAAAKRTYILLEFLEY
jgi:hypothetical protein